MRGVVEVDHIVVLALIWLMQALDEVHGAADEEAEHRDDPVDREIGTDHHEVDPGS